MLMLYLSACMRFNPRSHEGSDCKRVNRPLEDRRFQSTLPRRERPGEILLLECGVKGFNPRSHEGSDAELHTPAEVYRSFNPRSHEGSDTIRPGLRTRRGRFNPRSHEGSDIVQQIILSQFKVSIHAPTKGATARVNALPFRMYAFQSTLPRRERL